MKTVSILGAGSWGRAVAALLSQAHRVTLWGRSPVRARLLDEIGPPFRPERIDEAPPPPDADLVVCAIPVQHIESALRELPPLNVPCVSLSKGLETRTLRRPSEILRTRFPRVAVLSGPSFASEVLRLKPTSTVAASEDEALAIDVQATFSTPWFRVYTSPDLVGVELGGALKNVIAIAAGICDALSLGDNAKAALLTRGLAEMARLGVRLGARSDTFFGLAGMGDLIASCYSPLARNLQAGRELGAGKTVEEIVSSKTVEGLWTVRAVVELADRMEVPVPISREVYRIAWEGKRPQDALRDLMTRTLKPESPVVVSSPRA